MAWAQCATQKPAQPTLQDLWQATTAWTREYLVDVCADLPNTKQSKKALLIHQAELGDALDPYYGNKVSQEFRKLLHEQGMLTIDLIDATKKDDQKKIKETELAWKKNACALSGFLSKSNPYITFHVLRDMLYDYLAMLLRMISDRVQKKWKDDLKDYDKLRTQNAQLSLLFSQAVKDAFPPPAKKSKPVAPPPPLTTPLPPGTSIKKNAV